VVVETRHAISNQKAPGLLHIVPLIIVYAAAIVCIVSLFIHPHPGIRLAVSFVLI
jgi:hypothetical protein